VYKAIRRDCFKPRKVFGFFKEKENIKNILSRVYTEDKTKKEERWK